MSPGLQVILSGSLSLGLPLAFAVWELVRLRRGGGWSWRRDDPLVPPPAPLPTGLEAPRRPLPECLIPRPFPMGERPAPARVRELA